MGRQYRKPRKCVDNTQNLRFHGYDLYKGCIYGEDESGYFVYEPNKLWIEGAHVVVSLNRLVDHKWSAVLYSNGFTIGAIKAIWEEFGIAGFVDYSNADERLTKELKRQNAIKAQEAWAKEDAERKRLKAQEIALAKLAADKREIRLIMDGDGVIRKHKSNVNRHTLPTVSQEYVESSRKAYGSYVDMNRKRVYMSKSMACYMDGVFSR